MARRISRIWLMVASGTVITGAVGYLIFTTVSAGEALEYFKHVGEVAPQLDAWRGKRLRLHGNVVQGTIQKKKGTTLDYRFALHHGGRWVEVTYRGLVPDTFKECGEVVVKGTFGPSGSIFKADGVTAKCPSKYDEKQRATGCGEAHTETVLAMRRR